MLQLLLCFRNSFQMYAKSFEAAAAAALFYSKN
jgi:hypothetical protein